MMLSDEFDSRWRLDPLFRVMKKLIAEQCIKTVAVDADVIITYIAKKAVCGIAFHIFPRTFFFFEGAPLMGIMAGWTGDVSHMYFFPCLLVEDG